MYIVREIFYLHFGHYREVKVLIDEGLQKHLLSQPVGSRILTDFTGEGYRLIFEQPYATLSEFEKTLTTELSHPDWRGWYERFKPHVSSFHREILKQII
ncbi:MAG: hypothetical protein U0Y10_22560 [Spirosomataceae bacterium]